MKTREQAFSVATRPLPRGAVRRAALITRVTLGAAAALLLGACGQKGPLTLTPKPASKADGAKVPAAPASVAASAPSQR